MLFNSTTALDGAILSRADYSGNVSCVAIIREHGIVISGYQSYPVLFFADAASGNDAMSSDQSTFDSALVGRVSYRIFDTMAQSTWYTMSGVLAADSSVETVPGAGSPRLTSGALRLERHGDVLSAAIRMDGDSSGWQSVGSVAGISAGEIKVGLRIDRNYNSRYTIDIANLHCDGESQIYPNRPPPSLPPPVVPPRAMPPPIPPAPLLDLNLFYAAGTSAPAEGGGVLFNSTTALDGAILSRADYSGNVSCVAIIREHGIVISGYQSYPVLFFADAASGNDAMSSDQSTFDSALVGRVSYRIFDTMAQSTWYTMSGVLAADSSVETVPGAGSPRLTSGALRLERHGDVLSAAIRMDGDSSGWQSVGSVAGISAGEIKVGLRIDRNYNSRYTIDIANLHCDGESQIYPNRPPNPPEPQTPPPGLPPPPSPAPPPCWGPSSLIQNQSWVPMGIGGGGAQSSFSMSPISDLWFVGTDMGMLYRSEDRGTTWTAVSHLQARYSQNLPVSSPIGFSGTNPKVALHAPCFLTISLHQPCAVLRSEDAGHTWSPVNVTAPSGADGVSYNAPHVPNNRKYIRLWASSFSTAGLMFAATEDGVRRSTDDGATWERVEHPLLVGDSVGIYIDEPIGSGELVVHWASATGVYAWVDARTPSVVRSVYNASDYNTSILEGVGTLQSFAGGRSPGGQLTLAVVNSNRSACTGGSWDAFSWNGEARRVRHMDHCGDVLVQQADGAWVVQDLALGAYRVYMATNDGERVYTTGAREWDGGTGTRVRLATVQSGGCPQLHFTTVFLQVDVMNNYAKWDTLELSGVGLDVGYHDGGYYIFSVNALNSSEAGGSGNYFTHVTRDLGATWQSPFTQFAGCGAREEGKQWRSVGIEPTSNRLLKFHPTDPLFGISCAHDIAGLVTEDGGSRWRLLTVGINTIYDVAFVPSQANTIIAVTGSFHDWPHMWYGDVHVANGNVLISYDRGRTFQRLGGESSSSAVNGSADMRRQFLSVAYDAAADIVYAGSHSIGVARLREALSGNGTIRWEWIPRGMYGDDAPLSTGLIVPQIELDPEDGTVYCILSGNKRAAILTNQNRTGVYSMVRGGSEWTPLRSPTAPPAYRQGEGTSTAIPWRYPTAFAIDLAPGGDRNTIYLADFEMYNYLGGGIWKTTDGGATWQLKTHFSWPVRLTIDPSRPSRVYAFGNTAITMWGQIPAQRQYGYGGSLYTDNGGDTWQRDFRPPMQANAASVTIDPVDPAKVYYTYFGGGILHGLAPPHPTSCAPRHTWNQSSGGSLIVMDNCDNSEHGFARVVTVTSPGQFRISFSAALQGCGDNIVDLVNDPNGSNPLNPLPLGFDGNGAGSLYQWRPCLVTGLDAGVHDNYLDANMGTSIPRMHYNYMDPVYLQSLGPLVNISVLEANGVRVRVKTRTWWYGYEGLGVDPKLDMNHASEKTFTIYRDGRMYVRVVDELLEHDEFGGSFVNNSWPAGRATFIHPVNGRSAAGFTLATNYSMDAVNLYPRGGGVARWLLQWGQDRQADPINGLQCTADCTKMNFLQVPEDLSCEIGVSDRYEHIHFQDMHNTGVTRGSGYRWGNSPAFLDFEAWSNFTKNFLYQLGTNGSLLMPDVVTMDVANGVADEYLTPANMSNLSGGAVRGTGFNRVEGCYTLSSDDESLSFTLSTAHALRHPVFCIESWAAVSAALRVDGVVLDYMAYAYAAGGSADSRTLLVHLLLPLAAGAHEIAFMSA